MRKRRSQSIYAPGIQLQQSAVVRLAGHVKEDKWRRNTKHGVLRLQIPEAPDREAEERDLP